MIRCRGVADDARIRRWLVTLTDEMRYPDTACVCQQPVSSDITPHCCDQCLPSHLAERERSARQLPPPVTDNGDDREAEPGAATRARGMGKFTGPDGGALISTTGS